MHLPAQIQDLAVILGIAGVVTLLFRKIRQPVVLGYIVAGFIIGPYTPPFPLVTDIPTIKVWAELGVIFLMFALGLEFTFHKLTSVGAPAAGTALVEVVVMVLLGYGCGHLLGWNQVDSIFLGGMLSISSTTIILKAFEELRLKSRRFAQVVFGVLIVEDLIAIVLLAGLSTVGLAADMLGTRLFSSAAQLLMVVGGWFLIGYFLVPAAFRYVRRYLENETLIVLAVGLCLLLVVFATHFGYSAALGAFVMGSILAETGEHGRIETLIQPVRDVFAAIFFVSVGMLVDPKVLAEHGGAVALITLVTIVGKILSSTGGAILAGQRLKDSVQIGFSLSQIGEFSFIIATLGVTLGVISDFIYPIAVAVSAITTFSTPYLIRLSEPCAAFIERSLPGFWRSSLERYSFAIQQNRAQGDTKERRLVAFLTLSLNGILVTVIFLSVAKYLEPMVEAWTRNPRLSYILSWGISVVLSAPFIWGMFSSYRPKGSATAVPERVSTFLGQLVTIVWIGILTTGYFATGTSIAITFILGGLLFTFFYRRLEKSYAWFEQRLKKNLETSSKQTKEKEIQTLLPWDLHLAKLAVHPNSPVVGKTLKEGNYRETLGLNIVGIRRGIDTILSPSAAERLLPSDELLVLGTDEQIEKLRHLSETYEQRSNEYRDLSHYALKRILIEEGSPYAGKKIRDSGIREALKGLVVGMERGHDRTINPSPNTDLIKGDVLWVVGAAS
ncbi:MAG: cation:proton antiporter [Bdellovibrionota bacterium]